jgi:rubrerythrin
MTDMLTLLREAIRGEEDGTTIPVPVEDIRALLAEIQQRELHHFETEALLTQAGLDPNARPEGEYGQSEVLQDGTVAFGAPVATLEEAIRRRDVARINYPWPEEIGVGRRLKAGPWHPVHADSDEAAR